MNFVIKDMTKGKPSSILIFFALPMLLGNLFQQLYNVVDTIVVGNFVGEEALAAVGTSFPILFLFIGISTGLSMGITVVVSQLFGAGRKEDTATAIKTAVFSITVLGLVLTIVGFLMVKPLLMLISVPQNIMQDSQIYLQIVVLGSVFLFAYNGLTAVYNALGDSKSPLKFLIVATFTNIGLDLLFVIVLQMGVSGVALATVASQAIAAGLSLVFLRKKLHGITQQGAGTPFFDKGLLGKITRIAIPSMLQQVIISLGMFFVQNLINSFGSIVIAGFTSAMKIDSIAMMPMINLSNALSSFTGQNMGAGHIERIKKGYGAAVRITILVCAGVSLAVILWGRQMVSLFMDSAASAEAISVGAGYLQVVSSFYIVMGLMFIANGILRGTGDMKAFVGSSMVNLFFRVAFAYVLSGNIGYSGIFWSIPIGWGVGCLVSSFRYFSGRWQKIRVLSHAREQAEA